MWGSSEDSPHDKQAVLPLPPALHTLSCFHITMLPQSMIGQGDFWESQVCIVNLFSTLNKV